jgi:hypothetical protein
MKVYSFLQYYKIGGSECNWSEKLEKQRGISIGRTAGYQRVQILFMGCSGFLDREGSELQLQGEVLRCLHCTTEYGVRVRADSEV